MLQGPLLFQTRSEWRSEGRHLHDLHHSGLASVGQGPEDLGVNVLVLSVGHTNVHSEDGAGDHLRGEAHDLEGLVFVVGLGLDVVAQPHHKLDEFWFGLLES